MNTCEVRGGYEKRGGGGVLSVLGLIRKARGGAVCFRSDTKSGGGGGGGGGGGCLPYDDLYIGLCVRA